MIWLKRHDLLLKLFPYDELINPYIDSLTNSLILPCTRNGQETLLALKAVIVLQKC